jgi:microcompartment protein CcmK/EutM
LASAEARCELLATAPDVVAAHGGRAPLALPPLAVPAAVSAPTAGGGSAVVSGPYGYVRMALQQQDEAPPSKAGWVTLGGLTVVAVLPHPASPSTLSLVFALAPHPALVPVDAATGAPVGDRVPLDGMLDGQSLTGAAWAPAAATAKNGLHHHTLLLSTPGGIVVAAVDPTSLAVTATARAGVVPHLLPVVAAGSSDDASSTAVTAVGAGAGRVWALLTHGSSGASAHQGRPRQEVRAYRWPSWELAAAWDAPRGGSGGDSDGTAWTGLAVAPEESEDGGADGAGEWRLLLASARGGAVWSLPLPGDSQATAPAPLVPAACVLHHGYASPL